MTVLTFIFLICSLRVNVIFVLVLLGALIAFSLVTAALFIEGRGIELLGMAQALAMTDPASAAAAAANGMGKLSMASKLISVCSIPHEIA